MQNGIKTALSSFPSITTKRNANFFMSNCVYVNINSRYPNVTFQEYAPINFAYFRILYEANDYYSSFDSPLRKLNYSFLEQFPQFNTSNSKYLIESISNSHFTTMIEQLPNYFAHFCKHPATLLPNIVGIYILKYKFRTYYLIATTIMFPPNKGKAREYDLGGSDTYNPSYFVSDYPHGLNLPFDIKNEYIDIIKNDSLFLMECNMINYILLIIIQTYSENLHESVTNLLKPESNFAFLSNDDNKNKYNKGMVIRKSKDNGLIVVHMKMRNLLQKYTFWKAGMNTFLKVIPTTNSTDNVSTLTPTKYQTQYINNISRYGVFYKYF